LSHHLVAASDQWVLRALSELLQRLSAALWHWRYRWRGLPALTLRQQPSRLQTGIGSGQIRLRGFHVLACL
jgi:hypothetical protein